MSRWWGGHSRCGGANINVTIDGTTSRTSTESTEEKAATEKKHIPEEKRAMNEKPCNLQDKTTVCTK